MTQPDEGVLINASDVDAATANAQSVGLAARETGQPSVEIKISSGQTTVKAGDTIWIDVVTTNITYH